MNVFSIYFFQIRFFQVTLGGSQVETKISNFENSEICEIKVIFGDFRPKMGQNYRNMPKFEVDTISIPTANLKITIAAVFFHFYRKITIFSIFYHPQKWRSRFTSHPYANYGQILVKIGHFSKLTTTWVFSELEGSMRAPWNRCHIKVDLTIF